MIKLSPSILAADFLNLGEEIRQTDQAGTQYIHVDVMDGVFVPSISFGMPVLSAVRSITQKFLDVHLMIVHPENYIEEFVACGADCITFHVEACECVEETLQTIKRLGIKAGLSISPDTPVEAVFPFLHLVDMILIMTVHPGYGGQQFIPECREKVVQLRDYLNQHSLDLDIEVDGGIKIENVKMILEAGANVIVAGSAVFEKERTAENTKKFLKLFGEWEEETAE